MKELLCKSLKFLVLLPLFTSCGWWSYFSISGTLNVTNSKGLLVHLRDGRSDMLSAGTYNLTAYLYKGGKMQITYVNNNGEEVAADLTVPDFYLDSNYSNSFFVSAEESGQFFDMQVAVNGITESEYPHNVRRGSERCIYRETIYTTHYGPDGEAYSTTEIREREGRRNYTYWDVYYKYSVDIVFSSAGVNEMLGVFEGRKQLVDTIYDYQECYPL